MFGETKACRCGTRIGVYDGVSILRNLQSELFGKAEGNRNSGEWDEAITGESLLLCKINVGIEWKLKLIFNLQVLYTNCKFIY